MNQDRLVPIYLLFMVIELHVVYVFVDRRKGVGLLHKKWVHALIYSFITHRKTVKGLTEARVCVFLPMRVGVWSVAVVLLEYHRRMWRW